MLEKCHFIGIGGAGMSGLAKILLSKKARVTGSDIQATPTTENLEERGAEVFIGHSASHVSADMTVVYSTDIKKENPEYQAALALKCPLIHRSELLQRLMEGLHGLAVAGTHGKTTTSALLAWVLQCSGLSPSYAIGGVVPQLASYSGSGKGPYFVAEACESDGTFLNYKPFGAIVTNIDLDHLDYYQSESALIETFRRFMEQTVSPDLLFWCGDDSRLQGLQMCGVAYGFGSYCLLRASKFRQQGWSSFFDVEFRGKIYRGIEVSLTGRHNALNALAVFGLALSLGLEETSIRQALRTFQGVLRRCERKGEAHGILFIDDYAHHPTEICATLKAIRKAVGERRLVAIYQPHRYSRAKECQGLYKGAFNEADALFVTEIYAAREQPIAGVTHDKIIAEIQQDLKQRCQYVERRGVAEKLGSFLRPHDVVVTLGAGDVTKASQEILSRMAHHPPAKLKVCVVFGGMSVEHDVSLLSAENILAAIRSDYYEVEKVGITREGRWILGAAPQELSREEEKEGAKMPPDAWDRLLQADILFPVMHGTNGEDGTLQGFFDVFSKAYAGPNHSSAAISMDKALSKRLMQDKGIPVLPFAAFSRYEWDNERAEILKTIQETLRYPLFVKPTHLGSSIGVHKVADQSQLQEAVEDSFRFDTHLIVENGLEDLREIEFSLIGNDEIEVFPPGEVFTEGKIHDFDSKYGLNPAKPAAAFAERAKLPEYKINEGMELVKRAYRALGCVGMARVDTFLDKDANFWFNEINPIPGFTKYSLYPMICATNGIPLSDLIDRLIILGLKRRRQLDRLEIKARN